MVVEKVVRCLIITLRAMVGCFSQALKDLAATLKLLMVLITTLRLTKTS